MDDYTTRKSSGLVSLQSAWPNSTGQYHPPYTGQIHGSGNVMESPDGELLDLWDNIWFGVSVSPTEPFLHRHPKVTADPLDSVPILIQPLAAQALMQPATAATDMQSLLQVAVANSTPALYLGSKLLGVTAIQQVAAAPAAKLRQPPTPEAADRQMLVSSGSGEGQPAASSVVPVPDRQLSPQRQIQQAGSQQQQDQDSGPAPYVLGTWAQRQYIMPVRKARSPEHPAEQSGIPAGSVAQPIPSNGRWPLANPSGTVKGSGSGGKSAAADLEDPVALAQAHGSHAAALAAAQAAAEGSAGHRGRHSTGTDDEDEAVTQAAWRWRFTKRWQAEQTRAPQEAASVGDGGMEEALQYLAACGENWHLARAASTEIGRTVESRMLGTLGTPSLLGAELLVDESYSAAGSGRGGLLQSTESGGYLSREASHSGMGRGEATQQVSGITKRAAQLLAAQSDINKAVTQRWREVQSAQASDLWVGALLESVEVDDWGKYKFLLLRIRDRAGRQKLLVRGANYASDAKLVEGLHRQMMSACAGHDVPPETIEVVGGGVMEWRRHRDRHLHISGGYVAPAGGLGGPSTPCEVMNLAAVLTKQHLPMHYKVTSEGGKAL